jgi:endonuclease/exonuclease/phosphatase family metal-dependent hydrolase
LKNKASFIVSCFALLIFLSWFYSKYWSSKNVEHTSGLPYISILSMNVGQHLVETKSINSFILEQNTDIVLLQEITGTYIENGWKDLVEIYPYQIHGPLLSEKRVGMGILSRYPIISSDNFKLAKEGLVFQQRVVAQIDEKKVAIYNIHTTYPWFHSHQVLPWLTLPFYDYSVRSKEVQTLVKLLQNDKMPIIAAGDFNMTDQAQDYSYLNQILIDAFQQSGKGLGFTWPAHKNPGGNINLSTPMFRIDYILHSDDWISSSARVLSGLGSDHLPITTKLLIK